MRCPLLKVLYFLARFAIIGLRPMTYYQKEGDWLIPKDEKHFETIIAPLCEVKPAFKEFLGEEMLRFGGALRAHVADIVRERPHLAKSEVCEKFGFSSRVYNLVVNMGDAACSSATELLEDDRQKKTERLETLVDEAAKIEEKIAAQERSWQARRELGDERAAYKQTAIAELKKKLKYKQKAIFYARRKLDNLPTRPHVFLGGKALYYSQPGKGATQEEREAWRWEYLAARNRVCGARGSADEKGGNSTYQLAYVKDITRSIKVLGRKNVYTVMKFSVAFGGEVVTSVCLPEKEGRQLKAILDINNEKMLYEEVMTEDENPRTVKRAITTGRTALKITFMRDWRNDLRIYISYPIAGKPKPMAILGSIGIDINYGHCESLEVGLAGGKIKWGRYRKNEYDRDASTEKKMVQLSAIVREIVGRAAELGYAVSMENLDWERDKQTLKNRFGSLLHKIPYRSFTEKVRRECVKAGVPFRLVRSEYSSYLGNILATLNPWFSRDVAAAGITALRACDGGNDMILSLIAQVTSQARKSPSDKSPEGTYSMRINEKGKFGRNVEVVGIPLCQSDNNDPGKTGRKTPQQRAGATIKTIAEAVSALKGDLQRRGRIRCRAKSCDGEPNPNGPKLAAMRRRSRKVSQAGLFAQLCA